MLVGQPLLVQAVQQAMQKWRDEPTLLKGEPADVNTEIEVDCRITE